MKLTRDRLGATAVATLFALGLGVGSVLAAGGGEPEPRTGGAPVAPRGQKGGEKSTQQKKKQKKSEQEFRDGYRAAYALVQAGQFEAAFVAFKDLDEDDHPDVANYLGYTSRKLGRYDDAKFWYERALAANPKHVRTWQYYGMWHVEQGNMLKAADYLEEIKLICGGTGCKEYQDLKGGMEGTVVY